MRALGRRIGEKKARDPRPGRRPYLVDCWRIANDKTSQPSDTARTSTNEVESRTSFPRNFGSGMRSAPGSGHSYQVSGLVAISAESDKSPEFQFPLPSDHLLHLIHYNVFRALVSNKEVLRHFATIITLSDNVGISQTTLRWSRNHSPTLYRPPKLTVPDTFTDGSASL